MTTADINNVLNLVAGLLQDPVFFLITTIIVGVLSIIACLYILRGL